MKYEYMYHSCLQDIKYRVKLIPDITLLSDVTIIELAGRKLCNIFCRKKVCKEYP